jgi:hypothetical protein
MPGPKDADHDLIEPELIEDDFDDEDEDDFDAFEEVEIEVDDGSNGGPPPVSVWTPEPVPAA